MRKWGCLCAVNIKGCLSNQREVFSVFGVALERVLPGCCNDFTSNFCEAEIFSPWLEIELTVIPMELLTMLGIFVDGRV